jgi:hypothetical protein
MLELHLVQGECIWYNRSYQPPSPGWTPSSLNVFLLITGLLSSRFHVGTRGELAFVC